ncbi:MAG: SDR family oxidoreductase [Alphaproteobacteria bacterium]
MDLGLTGKTALVCASSKGLGKGCAMALAAEGCAVTITGRTEETLAAAAADIRQATGATVTIVSGDITTEAGRAAALAACPEPDILINNAGGPPPGDFHDWGQKEWESALQSNMLTPIFLIKAVVDGMIDRRFGRIVNITSGAVKAPLAQLGLSNGARAGLTGFVAGLARQTVRHNVTINNLLPGPFLTDRARQLMEGRAKKENRSIDDLVAERAKGNPAGRWGQPEEFGHACAWLCSSQSGFVTGQNILLDGGHYPGTL